MVESFDKMWFTRKGNGKPPQYSSLENPISSMKRQKYMKLKDKFPRSVGVQYATEEEWRNNSRKIEEMEPKQEKKKKNKQKTQSWIWLVMEVKSSAVKSSIA